MPPNVLTYLDMYCERGGETGAFGEPLNLVTNLFFIVAAILAGRAIARTATPGRRMDLWLLVGFLAAIGVGSGLWHLIPTRHTLLMDVIPITLFINLYLLSALRRLFGLSWPKVGLWWGLYFAASLAAQRFLPADLLNGSIMYVPTYLTLLLMTLLLWKRDAALGRAFAIALLVLTLSLAFRTADRALCPHIVSGTHFLWHTLNAWVLWRLLLLLAPTRR